MRTIILIVGFADLAVQTSPHLSPNTCSIANVEFFHIFAYSNHLSHNLVSNTKRKLCLTPTTRQRVNITTANSTSFDTDVDVMLPKTFRRKL